MADTKFTPGPWAVRYDYVVQAPSFDDGRLVPVAQPYGVNSDGTDLFANARLIAAAPELYQACATFEEWLRREEAGFNHVSHDRDTPQGEAAWRAWYDENLRLCALAQEQVRAALAKARGEQP